ncbi:MAG: hypothetical protein BGO92_18595 [Magnetospirillum sp. 64-120]|nr:MAG: hypothetical protein BGO92_18595 [Magnetospirillum sp. 64-120]
MMQLAVTFSLVWRGWGVIAIWKLQKMTYGYSSWCVSRMKVTDVSVARYESAMWVNIFPWGKFVG